MKIRQRNIGKNNKTKVTKSTYCDDFFPALRYLYRFVRNKQNSKYKQVGNSVPPLLAKALALKIKEFLFQNS